ncbi:CHAT domain-containing protein [Microdochium trichocladiopsis]|uniref:CHAT domain-containing protein n=1 Tax=Microdochium trichocladiopsis TaxID=1682393 RepID=A0A9P9BIA0_9PEZI|nr:CHAT domain-containing protein [Microdochium trichocladiopsis]KAH7014193.1 CHAT domain-containing protein [Microdochium trichocladiopsis]
MNDWRQCTNLGVTHVRRYSETKETPLLGAGNQCFRRAVDLIPEGHPDQADVAFLLGDGYVKRWMLTELCVDLQSSLHWYSQALARTPKDHSEYSQRCATVGSSYAHLFLTSRETSDLDMAIDHYLGATGATPRHHPEWVQLHTSLGQLYFEKFELTQLRADSELAIGSLQRAIEASARNDQELYERFSVLAQLYSKRHELAGDPEDNEIAISLFEHMLMSIPNTPEAKLNLLYSVGSEYLARYERTANESDLEKALKHLQRALDLPDEIASSQPGLFLSLGRVYIAKFDRYGTSEACERAIQHIHKALDITSNDFCQRVNQLSLVGSIYITRAERTGQTDDFGHAIRYYKQALANTPENDIDRPGRLLALGLAFCSRYEHADTLDDLNSGVRYFHKALDLVPAGRQDNKATLLGSLGQGYRARSVQRVSQADWQLSVKYYCEALIQHSSPFRDRLPSARVLLSIFAEAKDWELQLFKSTTGIPTDCAAVSLSAGMPYFTALEFLEQGRGVVAGFASESHVDVSDLEKAHPHEYARFMGLQKYMNSNRSSDYTVRMLAPSTDVKQLNLDRYDACQQYDRLIHHIRGFPGFERFLLAPAEKDLKAAARSGPIVIVNISQYRCDAIIVQTDNISLVELPDLRAEDVEAHAKSLESPDCISSDLCEWLWDSLAERVLAALGLTKTPEHSWSRVWWIGTGHLAKLPIHAAGYHRDGSERTVMDRVISSYGSSIRALMKSRQARAPRDSPEASPREAVLVEMSRTPGHHDLQFAQEEVKEIGKLCLNNGLHIKEPASRGKELMDSLEHCEIFHFAGHGQTDSIDPSRSGLVLSDGILSIGALVERFKSRRTPFLAFLSACGTGQTKGELVPDESLHLITAFQVIGFRHVLGTLWQVNDGACIDVATSIYQWMFAHGTSDESIAGGLHHAIRRLRGKWLLENDMRSARIRFAKQQIQQTTTPRHEMDGSTNRHVRIPTVIDDDDEETNLLWAPWVHYGC